MSIFSAFMKNSIFFKKQVEKSKEELEIERLNKIRQKAQEIVKSLDADIIENNRSTGDTGVYISNNAWVVKPHHYTREKIDLKVS